MAYPQSIALHPQFLILNASFSILLPQISLIQPHFSIFYSSFSILSQKNGIFDSKRPQNSVISDKMSASGACTACSFFQVRIKVGHLYLFLLYFRYTSPPFHLLYQVIHLVCKYCLLTDKHTNFKFVSINNSLDLLGYPNYNQIDI